ncbi:unnamed protein product [Lampetra planeri]
MVSTLDLHPRGCWFHLAAWATSAYGCGAPHLSRGEERRSRRRGTCSSLRCEHKRTRGARSSSSSSSQGAC